MSRTETDPEPEPKLFQRRNRNRNKSLRFHSTRYVCAVFGDVDTNSENPDPERRSEPLKSKIVRSYRRKIVFYLVIFKTTNLVCISCLDSYGNYPLVLS